MSTALLGHHPPLPAIAETDAPSPSNKWTIATIALFVGLAFFISEHSLDISLADAYTQTADEMEISAAGGNTMRRISFFAIAGMGLWMLFSARRQPVRLNVPLAMGIAAYLAVSAASLMWTVDPGMCLRRLMVLACCVLAILGIARRLSIRELSMLAVAVIGPLILLGLLTEMRLGTFRPWSGDYRFSGSVHPNTQGMYLTAIALASMGLARTMQRGRWLLWSLFGACIVLLLLTKSRTGNASTMVAIGSVLLLQTSTRFKLSAGFIAAWLGLACLWLLMLCGIDPLVDFRNALLLGRAEESDTLSGRAFIWPLVSHFVSMRPWLGYGYEAFWNPSNIDIVSEELGWGVREAHNGYLDILLSTGIIGLTCACFMIVTALFSAARASVRLRDPAYTLPLGMLVFGVLASVMESGMVNIMFPSFLVACCVVRMALFETNREHRADCQGVLKR